MWGAKQKSFLKYFGAGQLLLTAISNAPLKSVNYCSQVTQPTYAYDLALKDPKVRQW